MDILKESVMEYINTRYNNMVEVDSSNLVSCSKHEIKFSQWDKFKRWVFRNTDFKPVYHITVYMFTTKGESPFLVGDVITDNFVHWRVIHKEGNRHTIEARTLPEVKGIGESFVLLYSTY